MENTSSSPMKIANLNKYITVRITFLDDSVQQFHVSIRALGQHLYNQVIAKLQLLESDYFDLEFTNKEGVTCWLDHMKLVVKQSTQTKEYIYTFGIKFYPPFPNMLEDEYTRYLFALQIKRDIYQGHLQCNINTAALLLAFIAQSEIGDFLEDEYMDVSYLSALRLTKHANEDFLFKVMECHRTLIGQSPSEADYNLLDTARKVESYGIRLHTVRDAENLPLRLAVTHQGILIYQNRMKVNTFCWAKVRKLSFKRKHFYIKLHTEGYEVIDFIFNCRNECKNFWKKCIEHHAFFRCQSVKPSGKRRGKVLSKGSSFRYTGRTQKQLQDSVRETNCQRPQFERSQSMTRVTPKSPASSLLNQQQRALVKSSTPGSYGGSGSQQAIYRTSAGGLVHRNHYSDGAYLSSCHEHDPSAAAVAKNNQAAAMGLLLMAAAASGAGGGGSCSSTTNRPSILGGGIGGGTASSASYTMNSSARSVSSSEEDELPPDQEEIQCSPVVVSSSILPMGASRTLPSRSYILSTTDHINNNNNNTTTRSINHLRNNNNCEETPRYTVPNYSELARLMSSSTGAASVSSEAATTTANVPAIPPHANSAAIITLPNGGVNAGSLPNRSVHHVMSNEELRSSLTYLHKSQQKLDDLLLATMAAVGIDQSNPLMQLSSANQISAVDSAANHGAYMAFTGHRSVPDAVSVASNSSYLGLMAAAAAAATSNSSAGISGAAAPISAASQLTTLLPGGSQLCCDADVMILPTTSTTNQSLSLTNSSSLKAALLNELKLQQSSSNITAPPTPPIRTEFATVDNYPDLLPAKYQLLGLSQQQHQQQEHPASDDDQHANAAAASFSSCLLQASSRPASAASSRISVNTQGTRDHSLNLSRGGSLSRRSSTNSSRRSHSNKKHKPVLDKSYYIIKEIVNTERTYKRSLDIICIWFRKAVTSGSLTDSEESRLPEQMSEQLFSLVDPLHEEHCQLLRDLEARINSHDFITNTGSGTCMASSGVSPYPSRSNSRSNLGLSATDITNEDGSIDRNARLTSSDSSPLISPIYQIGNIFIKHLSFIPLYKTYLESVEQLLLKLDQQIRLCKPLRDNIRKFEAQKLCFLPLLQHFLAPGHRILQYRHSLERLIRHNTESHIDYNNCKLVLSQLQDLIQSQWDNYKRTETTCKLLELQRDIVGFQNIVSPIGGTEGQIYEAGRQFIREGWLQKLGKRGYQPRMFFMFSDQLVYATRVVTNSTGASLQFKVHGQFPLHDLMIEESQPAHSFTVYSGNRCFLAAAQSQWQRDRWLEDVSRAILSAKSSSSLLALSAAGSSMTSSTSNAVLTGSNGAVDQTDERYQIPQRANSSIHVCWHRNCSLSFTEILRANENELSGYLLRKFKNSNGWQKLWVVFTQLCLFFYKNYQDDTPLASLPLIGYLVSQPSLDDAIRKDYVFKLQFKNHVYFFRADSQYTFDRWLEVLSIATGSANRLKSSLTNNN